MECRSSNSALVPDTPLGFGPQQQQQQQEEEEGSKSALSVCECNRLFLSPLLM